MACSGACVSECTSFWQEIKEVYVVLAIALLIVIIFIVSFVMVGGNNEKTGRGEAGGVTCGLGFT